jgi:hypothetical protein
MNDARTLTVARTLDLACHAAFITLAAALLIHDDRHGSD